MEKNELKKYKNIIKQGLSIREASLILKIAPATIFRRLKKLKQTGDIIHGNTGKQNRKPREDKEEIINLAETKYREFSISHICEMLEIREKININKETLRLWLKRPRKYRKPKQRQRRECSPNFGDLLQIDGSFDYWFGDKKTCLMHIVDDATNTAELYFDKQETIVSADDVCFIETERHLNNDWTFSYEGKIYQIPRLSKYPPAKSKIKLKITISGKIFVFYRDYSFSLF
ncbi:MAG: hypothetical protein MJ212_01805 [Alphaproteobacteria bacterium]|nr:hypothetical protein [Alphaproteobacteria bacterium]